MYKFQREGRADRIAFAGDRAAVVSYFEGRAGVGMTGGDVSLNVVRGA